VVVVVVMGRLAAQLLSGLDRLAAGTTVEWAALAMTMVMVMAMVMAMVMVMVMAMVMVMTMVMVMGRLAVQ
jgi:hypothetical protein